MPIGIYAEVIGQDELRSYMYMLSIQDFTTATLLGTVRLCGSQGSLCQVRWPEVILNQELLTPKTDCRSSEKLVPLYNELARQLFCQQLHAQLI